MKNSTQKIKSLVRWLHLWFGLISGIIIFIVSITGCIYVFQEEISQFSEPWRFVNSQDAQYAAPSVLLDSAKQYMPDRNPYGITYSGKGEAAAVGFWKADDTGGNYTVIFLNPYSANYINKQTVIGRNGFNFFRFILNGHRALWLPYDIGHQIVGYSVIVFVILLVTGIIMWWPKKWNIKSIKRNFTVNWKNGFRKLNHDSHNILGFYVTIFALIIAITGLTWSFKWVGNSIHFIASGGSVNTEKPLTKKEKSTTDSISIDPSKAMDICFYKALHEEPNPKRIYFSPNLKNTSTIEFIFYKYQGKYYNSNSYNYDITTTKPIRKKGDRFINKAFADKLSDMYYDIHTGAILGFTGKILAFLVSLICASLPITGFIIWFQKRKNKKKQTQIFTQKKQQKYMLRRLFKKKEKDFSANNLLILYGTKTGNAKLIAQELGKYSKTNQLKPVLINMSTCTPDILLKFSRALIVVSTHDEGDPPPSARKFYKQLLQDNNLNLNDFSFAVCALGDSSYDDFCEAGKTIEKKLLSLGANSILPRKDCDEDFGKEAGKWIKEIISQISEKTSSVKDGDDSEIKINQAEFIEGKISLCEKLATDPDGLSTYHLEINEFDRNFNFRPGDLIEILPKNPYWLVQSIANQLGTNKYNEELLSKKEISRIQLSTMEEYAQLTNNEDIKLFLLQPIDLIYTYLSKANILDVLKDFPSKLNAKEFIQLLPSLRGRQYSVTNYQNKEIAALELMIKTIRYDFQERKHEGAASIYTCENLQPGDIINFKHIRNPDFYLPESTKIPLIFIGVGTGYAPIRAFLHEWIERNSSSKAWVIWGEKEHSIHHKYYKELENLKSANLKLQVDTVSSRGQDKLKYVQDIVLSKSKDISSYLKEGAYVYICGSKEMGKGVDNAFNKIINLHNSKDQIKDLESLKDSGRYLSSVY